MTAPSRLLGMLAVGLAWWSCTAAGANEAVATRAAKAPALDGALDDPCWTQAAELPGFTVANSPDPPRKAIRAKVCFDDAAMYLGVACAEPEPDRIRAVAPEGSSDVWRDDCVEIFIRHVPLPGTFYQYIVNSKGVRQSRARKGGQAVREWNPQWQAAARVGAKEWCVEVAIPHAAMARPALTQGDSIGLKVGREDRVGARQELASWPGNEGYGSVGEFGTLFFGSAGRARPRTASGITLGTTNLIQNPGLVGGLARPWSGDKASAAVFAPETQGDSDVVRVKPAGGLAAISQSIALEPNSAYRFSVETRGSSYVDFRIRGTVETGFLRVTTRPTDTWQRYVLSFNTGEKPEILLVWGPLRQSPPGDVWVRNMKLVSISVPREELEGGWGPAILARPGEPCTVRKILVKDCRVLRGLDFAPVDGTVRTKTWNGDVYEYGSGGGYAGVKYNYKASNGLHLALADGQGVDALLIRGGAQCKLYADCPSYDSPAGGKLLADLTGNSLTTRACFTPRVMTDRFSFFDVTMGALANVSFFRVGRDRPAAAPIRWSLARKSDGLCEIGPGLALPVLSVTKGQQISLQSAPLAAEMCLEAIGLRFALKRGPEKLPLTLAVQDPNHPHRELMGVDLELQGAGDYCLCLDFPNQVILPGRPLWLMLTFGGDAELGDPAVALFTIGRPQAVAEALAYNKMLMLAQFIPLSEPRPWMRMKRTTTDDLAWAATERQQAGQVAELLRTIALCRQIDPEDDAARQMDEWVHQIPRDVFNKMPEPDIARTPGAPEWADVLHQTWLGLRAVPEWWLDHRLVPTGEMGGGIGDDTDMYQNWADFALLESDGVGGRLVEACRNLGKLIEETVYAPGTGIPSRTTDPLHYAEDGLNHMAMMVWMDYGNPYFVESCLNAARSTEEGLTTLVRGTERYFKSQDMGGDDLRIQRPLGQDGGAHFICIHPSFMPIWYCDNPRAKTTVQQWADGWLRHYQPRRYAQRVDSATGQAVTEGEGRPEATLSTMQGAAQVMVAMLLGDRKYARPLQDVAEAGDSRFAVASLPKAVTAGLVEVNAKVKASARQTGGYTDFVVNGNREELVRHLKRALAEVRHYKLYYTAFEPFTDRLFMGHPGRPLTLQLGAAYLGGSYTRNSYANTHAVSWSGFGTHYAALCLTSTPTSLKFLIYSFADGPLAGRMTVWSLKHGRYKLTQGIDANNDDAADTVARQEEMELHRGMPVSLALPPRQVTVLEALLIEELPDIRNRPDLAVTAMELKREGAGVSGWVHNIGAQPAEVVVVLVDASGKVLQRLALGALEAPLDLRPRKLAFRFADVPADAKGLAVVVDPDNRNVEIYKGNNRAQVPDP